MPFPTTLYMLRSSTLADLADFWIEVGCCQQMTKRHMKLYSDKAPGMTFERFDGRLRCSVCGRPPAYVVIDEAQHHRAGSRRFLARGDPDLKTVVCPPIPKSKWKPLV